MSQKKRGKQTERRAGSFGRPRNSTRWKYISHRERLGYEARRLIRLYMKPGGGVCDAEYATVWPVFRE